MKLNKSVVETDVDYLHQKCELVNISDTEECKNIVKKLYDAYNQLNGRVLGLAAIQIRMTVCATLVKYYNHDPIIVFNPKVIFKFGSRKSNEGCESEKPYRYIVKRPMLAVVSYYTENGKKTTKVITFRKARIFLHEYDHTQGVLLQDIGKRVT